MKLSEVIDALLEQQHISRKRIRSFYEQEYTLFWWDIESGPEEMLSVVVKVYNNPQCTIDFLAKPPMGVHVVSRIFLSVKPSRKVPDTFLVIHKFQNRHTLPYEIESLEKVDQLNENKEFMEKVTKLVTKLRGQLE